MWLGNGERNFYGSGPWKDGGLKVVWQVETGFMSGRLHKDPWGTEYAYARSGEGYDVYSYGPDKAQGGGDDISVHGGEGGGAAPSASGGK